MTTLSPKKRMKMKKCALTQNRSLYFTSISATLTHPIVTLLFHSIRIHNYRVFCNSWQFFKGERSSVVNFRLRPTVFENCTNNTSNTEGKYLKCYKYQQIQANTKSANKRACLLFESHSCLQGLSKATLRSRNRFHSISIYTLLASFSNTYLASCQDSFNQIKAETSFLSQERWKLGYRKISWNFRQKN